jgi:hypothetical protein
LEKQHKPVDKVQKIDTSNSAPCSKTFRDDQCIQYVVGRGGGRGNIDIVLKITAFCLSEKS